MNTTSYIEFHTTLLNHLLEQTKKLITLEAGAPFENGQNIIEQLESLLAGESILTEAFAFEGQTLVGNLIRNFPELMPHVARDLLWLFGGECLHFMEDNEIEAFQHLAESYHDAQSAEDVDYKSLRNTLMGDDYFTPTGFDQRH